MKMIYSKKNEKTHTVISIFGIKIKLKKGRLETRIKRKEKNYDIGILSVNINSRICNYGAALHSFAFYKYLEKQGVNSVIINYYPESIKTMFVTAQIMENIKAGDFSMLLINLKNAYFIFLKKFKFIKFFRKNCKVTKHRYEIDTLSQLTTVKRFVCETDTIWHKFKTGFDRGFFCDLENMKNKDNVAYSVDFGSREISEKNKEKLKKYARNFKYISIRNIFKLNYFKDVINRDDVVVTIDPVFLLDKEDYLPVIKEPKLKHDYVLVFNCVENNPQMVEKAEKYSKKNNLKLVVINSFVNNITDVKNSFPTPIGIEEFLGYIKNSRYFFTNSYHGICFAVIFGVKFCCFERKGNNDKILTILELFGLHDRLVNSDVIPEEEINCAQVEQRLKNLRKFSEDFISKAIICIPENYCP